MNDEKTRNEIKRLRAAGFSLANAERMAGGKNGPSWFLIGCLLAALFLLGSILTLAYERHRSAPDAVEQVQTTRAPQEEVKA